MTFFSFSSSRDGDGNRILLKCPTGAVQKAGLLLVTTKSRRSRNSIFLVDLLRHYHYQGPLHDCAWCRVGNGDQWTYDHNWKGTAFQDTFLHPRPLVDQQHLSPSLSLTGCAKRITLKRDRSSESKKGLPLPSLGDDALQVLV